MALASILRNLGRTKGFAASVVGTIALGVGASSAIFSVVYTVLLRPLPYPAPDRLVMVWQTLKLDPALRVDPEVAARLAQRSMVISTVLPAWRRDNHAFEEMGGFLSRPFSLTGTPNPERVDGIVATSSFFRVLGVRPIAGRVFTATEELPGQDDVVLVSDALWQRRFGRDPQAVGRAIGIDGAPHVIVGVLPADLLRSCGQPLIATKARVTTSDPFRETSTSRRRRSSSFIPGTCRGSRSAARARAD